jgi:hypothetical protein
MFVIIRHVIVIVVLLFADTTVNAQNASGYLQGVLGANKLDLASQYLGYASNGDGSAPYMAVLPAMGKRAIQDAGDLGFRFVRVMAAGYGPVTQADLHVPSRNPLALWQSDPATYWARMDAMFNDLSTYGMKIVPVFVWNPFEFPAMAGETLNALVTNQNSQSRTLLKQYISDFITRYQARSSILFYELTNELNLETDIDIAAGCRAAGPSADCSAYGNITTEQLNNFATAMVKFIHTLDTSHQIGSGYTLPRASAYHLMLQPGFSASGPDWTNDTQAQFQSMELSLHTPFDLMSIHLYPGDIRWGNLAGSEYLTLDGAAAAATAAGKKLYVGEFGANAVSPFLSSIMPRLSFDKVAYAAVWVWEFYQVNTYQNTDITFAANSTYEPGFTDSINATFQQAAGTATFTDRGTPRVVLTSPLPCATLPAGLVKLYAAASANAPVQKVTFSVDGQNIGTATAAPFQVPYTVTGTGIHSITATAYAGSRAAASTVNVVFQSTRRTCVAGG